MVKNLPAVERSTKIRFGKNVPEATDQAENTIVFNASNTLVPATNENAVYLSPIRNRPDYTEPQVVLLMYDKNTKEITESGESANALVGGATLALTVNRANVTSNTVQFRFSDNNTGFVTDSNVGISNLLPQHTVSVGSNLYIDEFGSNVLVVSGNVAVLRDMVIDGNLRVNGDTTIIYAENTAIRDALIELGQNNTSDDTTLDLGILMHRPDALSNVVIGYREGTDEFAIGYTDANPTDKTFTPKTDEDINVHVYGLTHVDANIYAHEDLLVDGNVYVSQNVSVTEELTISNNVYAQKDLEVMGNVYVDGNVVAYKDFTLTGNAYVSGNVTVTEELTISNNVYADKDLEVMGNVYVDGNVVAYKDFTLTGNAYVSGNVSVTEELTISNNVYAQKDLEVVGNVYVDGNVVAYKDFTLTGNAYVSGNVSVTEELTISNNVYAQKDLEVMGNVYVDGNVVAYKDFTLTGNAYVSGNVSVTEELTVSGNVYANIDLEVLGNVYVDGNVVAYKDFTLTGNAYVSGNVSVTEELTVSGNVYADKDLEVMGNVYVDGNVVAYKDLLVSGNVYTLGNTSINDQLTISGNVYAQKDIEVTGAVYVDGNVVSQKDILISGNAFVYQNVSVSEELTVFANIYAGKDIEVLGAIYADSNIVTYKDLSVSGNIYVSQNVTIAKELTISGNVYAGKDIEIIGNTYIDGNVIAYKDLLVSGNVNTTGNIVGHRDLLISGNVYVSQNVSIGDQLTVSANVYAQKDIEIAGNVLTTGNTSISGVLNLTNATTAIVTNPTSSVGINVGQLKNVNVASAAVEQVIVYDGTTWNNQYIDQTLIRVKNANGGELSKGTVVCTTGHVGNDIFEVVAANASDPDRMPAIGVLYQTLAENGEGVAVSFGRADGLNTGSLDVSNFIEGETLYVSNTVTGGLSNVKPYGLTDLIQNAGILVNKNSGVGFITGIGRANDIPNAVIETSNASVNYVYVNSENNDLRKIDPMKLPTKFQTLAQVVNTGNTVSNTINVTGLTTTGNVNVTSNISVAGLIDPNNKYLPMVDTNGYFVKSPVYVTNEGKYIISASEAEFLGNITLGGNTTIISSTSITISDRIFGVGANNSATGLDSGFIIEHQDGGTFANVGLIHHADEHRFSVGYTQNSFTDNHILHYQHADGTQLRIDLLGNTLVQNNLTVNETGTFGERVGIKTITPAYDLDVRGTSNVGALSADSVSISDTTASSSKTSGALQVTGGVGIQGALYGAAGNFDGVTSVTNGTASSSKTSGALQVTGGVGIQGALYGAAGNFDGVTSVTNGTASSSKTSGALRVTGGVGISGALYGAAGNFDGVTSVTNGTASSSKTTGALRVTGGVGIQGALYGANANLEDVEADSVNITDSTASSSKTTGALKVAGGVGIQGALYGAAGNFDGVTSVTNASASSSKTSGALQVTGGVGIQGALYGANANLEDVEADSVNITDSTASSSKITGALRVTGGVGIQGALYGANANLEDVEADSLTITDTTQSTGTGTGAVIIAGGLGVASNIHTTNMYITDGLITNTGGVTKKTYSYTGAYVDAQTVANATLTITFSEHVFYAKIVAHLIEGDAEVSTLSLEVGGGHRTGGTPLAIAKGPQAIFGSASTNPWDSTVTTTTTTVVLKPTTNLSGPGNYNIFVEYISAHPSGRVVSINEGVGTEVTFAY
jgi:predicted acyltransferase (DUF342 family)